MGAGMGAGEGAATLACLLRDSELLSGGGGVAEMLCLTDSVLLTFCIDAPGVMYENPGAC